MGGSRLKVGLWEIRKRERRRLSGQETTCIRSPSPALCPAEDSGSLGCIWTFHHAKTPDPPSSLRACPTCLKRSQLGVFTMSPPPSPVGSLSAALGEKDTLRAERKGEGGSLCSC